MKNTDARVIWEIPDEEVQWDELEQRWGKEDDELIREILRGREGLNEGLDNGLKRLNTYIHGTHRGRYILMGGESGSGKSQLGDFMYLYSLWRAAKKAGVRIYIKYFSFELSRAAKKAKWVAQWIKGIYNVDLPTDYITGKIGGLPVTPEHLRLIQRAYQVVEEMMKDISLEDGMLHPTGILNRLVEDHFEKIGKVERAPVREGKKKGMILGYKPNDPSAWTVLFLDHAALINTEKGAETTKLAIDRTSMYLVQMRNIFNLTSVVLQQFNPDMLESYRSQRKSEAAIAPQRLDFGDSRYTYRDSDLVFGLVSPAQFELKTFHGFNIRELGDRFLALYLMKNRYGPANRMFPLFFNPISGMFYDMPLEPNNRNLRYYVEETARIEQLCRQFSSPQGVIQ